MRSALALVVIVLALGIPRLSAQVPGDYPHLVLADSGGQLAPPPGGPFNNSWAFHAYSGLTFEARLTYASPGQPNSNVLWGVFISTAKTPFPTNIIPPPLFTMPPFIFIDGVPPTLDGSGFGKLKMFVPAGVYAVQSYVQGLVYDSTSGPKLQLSNGLTLDVQVPDFNVHFSFLRSKPEGGEGQMRDVGNIDIDANTLNTLKPIGPVTAPMAIPDPPPLTEDFRLLPIAPNGGDEPVNPRARPMTRVVGAVDGVQTTIPVQDTEFFPMRGRLLLPLDESATNKTNLWDKKAGAESPLCEVISYEGKTATSFLNCQRKQLGSRVASNTAPANHADGHVVLGDFTMATTTGALGRSRVSLDAENVDMPHVVIPPFTFDDPGTPEVDPVTLDLDLYIYETIGSKRQGFMLLDRTTGAWRAIPGTEFGPPEGRWEPWVTVAPDRRSFVAVLSVPGGVMGWDNNPDKIFAIRLDGLDWPASGAEAWQITYHIDPDPVIPPSEGDNLSFSVRARRPWATSFAIVGSSPANYVLYAGLAHKWAKTTWDPQGTSFIPNYGFECEYVNEEVIVRDVIECPLVAPGSGKAPPSMPRPYINADFGLTGLGNFVIRFDQDFLPSPDHKQLLLAGGASSQEEDVFTIRNVVVLPNGTVSRIIANLTGYEVTPTATNAGKSEVRPFAPGGHGQGRRAAFSPNGARVAWLVRDTKGAGVSNQRRDWIDVAATNGASYGQVQHIWSNLQQQAAFISGPPLSDKNRAVDGLRFLDNSRLTFMMGVMQYEDPAGLQPPGGTDQFAPPGMDLFVYDIPTNFMLNLTRTDGSDTGFGAFGKIVPAGYFASPDGSYAYLLRSGNLAVPAPDDLHVMNVIGTSANNFVTFSITGSEFGGSGIPDLDVPPGDVTSPVETAAALRFIEGSGVQDGMLYWAAHYKGGNDADNLFGFNLKTPFVAFAGANVTSPGVHVSDITPDPFGGKVAFSRTDTPAKNANNQHPFVLDLTNFMFERDLTPTWTQGGGAFWGRVMGGSFHFIQPVGNAGEALIFAFGLGSGPNGIADVATPAYYPLAGVSNPLIEPVPTLIPLVDTSILGGDYRFYIPTAGPSLGP